MKYETGGVGGISKDIEADIIQDFGDGRYLVRSATDTNVYRYFIANNCTGCEDDGHGLARLDIGSGFSPDNFFVTIVAGASSPEDLSIFDELVKSIVIE